jgi:hypothetical protein
MLQMFFGMVRQSSGADDHPSANQFLFIYRLLSVSSLVRPPKAASVQTDPSKLLVEIQALSTTKPKSLLKTLEEKLHKLLKTDDHWDDDDDIDDLLLSCITDEAAYVDNVTVDDNDTENCNGDLKMTCSGISNDDGSGPSGSSDLAMMCETDDCSIGQTILYYLGGYVAHKMKRYTKCLECLESVTGTVQNDNPQARLVLLRTRGGLAAPSPRLSSLLSLLEQFFERLKYKPTQDFYQCIINEILIDAELPNVAIGCSVHQISLTSRCIHFYIATRIHFINREYNKRRVSRQDKHRHSKLSKLT